MFVTLTRLRAALKGAVALALISPVALQAQPSPAPAQTPAGPAASTPSQSLVARPALWRVSDADTTIHILGTVHILRPGTTFLTGHVERAFNAADTLVLEMRQPDAAVMQQRVAALGVATDGKTVRSRMNDAQRGNYERALTALGIPSQAFDPLEPWMPAMVLAMMPYQRLGYDPAAGVEMVLTRAARERGKTLAELETFDQQLGFFDEMPMEAQLNFLDEVSKHAVEAGDRLTPLVTAWANADPDRLGELMNEGMTDPKVREILLTNRNSAWTTWLRDKLALRGGNYFVAVGAGHLAGPDSVITMLQAQGLTVERIQ